MTKALFVNGSPRKSWTTFKMLDSALNGAKESGAEVEMVHLYDLEFRGCMSCFACKLKKSKTNGLCAYKDSLTPILEKASTADVIVIGSPIYFSSPTGPMRSFLERMMFPLLSYNPKVDPETGEYKGTLLKRTIPTAAIFTMGCPEQMFVDCHYSEILGEVSRFMKMIYGHNELLYTYNSYQFNDYSRYDILEGVEQKRAKYRDEQFPVDLLKAYELGKRLAEMAKG